MDHEHHPAETGPEPTGPPVPPPPTAEQTRLPFGTAPDEPIPYRLTARARRAVAPETLPGLSVLSEPEGADDQHAPIGEHGEPDGRSDDGDRVALEEVVPDEPDDPGDTRAARARALRHAGIEIDQIADELDVDALLVRAWVDDITPVHSARRRLRSVPARPRRQEAEQRQVRARASFETTRRSARRAARDRISADPGFVSGLGVVAGVAEIGPDGIVLTTRDLAVARAALRWLGGTVDLEQARLRLLLRLAPQVAADRAVDEWARSTGVPTERIRHTRWRAAPTADAVEAMVRIADPGVAGAVAGWRDALLGSFDGGGDDLDLAW